MRTFHRMRPVAAIAAAGLLSTGLVATQAGSAEAAAGPTIRVFIGAGSVVHMTHRMHPGVHRFVVRSPKAVAFQIARHRRGYTKKMAAHDINAGLNNGNIPALRRFERNMTLLGGVSASRGHRGVMYADLTRGRYWAIDTNPTVARASRLTSIVVGGRRVAGNLAAGHALRAIHMHTWASHPASIPRHGMLKFANRSTDNHFIVMAKLLPGKTIKDFAAWVAKAKSGGNPGPPPVEQNGGLDSGVLSPGHAMVFHYALPPGRYVLTCFWPDADMGGLPHAFLGMFRELTVR